MPDSTVSALITLVEDNIGDASSGFYGREQKVRAINRARRLLYQGNYVPTQKTYTFNSVAQQEDYSLAGIEDYQEYDHLEYWKTGATRPRLYDWLSVRQYLDGDMPGDRFTIRHVAGVLTLSLQPKSDLSLSNALKFVYYPWPFEMEDGDATEDELINFYPPAAEIIADLATSIILFQEKAFAESNPYLARAQDALDTMNENVDHRTVSRKQQISFAPRY